jgi:hypothetical protein
LDAELGLVKLLEGNRGIDDLLLTVDFDELVNFGKAVDLDEVVGIGKVVSFDKAVDLDKAVDIDKVVDFDRAVDLLILGRVSLVEVCVTTVLLDDDDIAEVTCGIIVVKALAPELELTFGLLDVDCGSLDVKVPEEDLVCKPQGRGTLGKEAMEGIIKVV